MPCHAVRGTNAERLAGDRLPGAALPNPVQIRPLILLLNARRFKTSAELQLYRQCACPAAGSCHRVDRRRQSSPHQAALGSTSQGWGMPGCAIGSKADIRGRLEVGARANAGVRGVRAEHPDGSGKPVEGAGRFPGARRQRLCTGHMSLSGRRPPCSCGRRQPTRPRAGRGVRGPDGDRRRAVAARS